MSAALPAIERLLALGDDDLRGLRERLAAAGFSERTLAATEKIAPGLVDALRLPAVTFRLGQRTDAASLLARLFCYDDVVPAAAAAHVFGATLAERLIASGLLVGEGEGLRAAFRITPLEGVYFLSDPPHGGGDAVMGPGATTEILAAALPERPGASLLDVGCGAGTFALLAAARGCKRAVGVDVNPRAIALARWNARLNGLACELRQGDLLAPVQGERFELVVSQPPYVVAPAGRDPTTYLHGGPAGSAILLRLAAALPQVLAPGGRALLMFDAGLKENESAGALLRGALGPAPVDVMALTSAAPGADFQAIAYAQLEEPVIGPGYADAVRAYARRMDELGFARWVRTLAVLRAAPSPRERSFTITLPVAGLPRANATAIERLLAALDLAVRTDDELLDAKLVAVPGARLCQEQPLEPGAAPVETLRFPPTWLMAERELTDASAFLLGALCESGSARAALPAYAEACSATPDEVEQQLLAFVREALTRGMLLAA